MTAAKEDPSDAETADSAWTVVSRVNAGFRWVDDAAFGDDRDDFVAQVNLHGNVIESMDGLETFTRVVELCLSSNCIEEVSFHALEPLVSLRVLDLSANSIESTLGFPQLPSLEELSIAHNRLERLDGMTRPIKFPRLRYLDLRGNEISEFNGLIGLQRLKASNSHATLTNALIDEPLTRLAQLRMQAHDGSLANPLCDLDEYQDAMTRMLPSLKFLDEEEVELLKEVSGIRMPKYRSIMRRIASSNNSQGHPRSEKGSPTRSESSPIPPSTTKESAASRQHSNQLPMSNSAVQVSESLVPPSIHKMECRELKESATNTEPESFEKELARREQDISEREMLVKEIERSLQLREKSLLCDQEQLEKQVMELKERLQKSSVRANEAQDSLIEVTTRLETEAKKHAEAQRNFDVAVSDLKRLLVSKDEEWSSIVADVNERHQKELAALTASKTDADKSVVAMEARITALTEQLHAHETELKAKDAGRIKDEEVISTLTAEVKRQRADSSVLASQLSGESKSYKERLEDSMRRASQLEKQVVELQSNLETVYNKCIEKDEDIHQLKKSLLVKQSEVDELKAQHTKAMDRQDKLQQQQQDLYDKQLQTSMLQIEMEFRKEHQLIVQQYRELQRRYHDAVKETRRMKDAYSLSRKREAGARAEINKIQAILADDKQKLYAEDAKRTDEFEHKLRESEDRCRELEQQIDMLRVDNERIAALNQRVKYAETSADELNAEIGRLNGQQEVWRKQEDDLRAALKVKDVMLNDQLRQIRELRCEREELEGRFNDEMAELQGQVEELEAALDDSAQRVTDEETKCEAIESERQQLEHQVASLKQQVNQQASALEHKGAALDFIEQEMEKMRTALSNQDAMFQKRLQKRLEQYNEELERARVAGEEERERLRIDYEADRRDMMSRYQSLSTDLQSAVAQNATLRIAIEQEHKKTAQNDHDMRVLLAQIDRERHMKQEHLRQIKSLFEQLQREVP